MANKPATKKKSTVSKKAAASKKALPIGIYKENYPDCHVATGKYKFFFVVFDVF